MKITIDMDTTPLELRQFLGFPDVQPMQKAVMTELEKKMMAQLEHFSPESLMRAWFLDMPQNADWVRETIGRVFTKASGGV